MNPKLAQGLPILITRFVARVILPFPSDLTKLFMLAGIVFASVTDLVGQNAFEEGKGWYEQRAAKADSFLADSENINKAIEALKEALNNDINPEQSAIYLLQSYYFKGMFTGMSEDQQKETYNKGRELGEEMMKKFPDSVPIKFWYGANIGRWAAVHGFLSAATNGIAGKLRRVCKDIIELDPKYQGGGGYRILAQVHFHSPNIPILMGWPSDEKALELVEEAMKIAPDHPTNRMLYAQILLEFDRNEEAREQLRFILDNPPRPGYTVEDRYLKHRSKQLIDEHF